MTSIPNGTTPLSRGSCQIRSGYCSERPNGFCEMFRAAERRRYFSDGDLLYLAHLCHNCGNCWPACQYAPPHPFAVNVPQTLADARKRSWRDRSWLALAIALLSPALALVLIPGEILFARHAGPSAFYAVLPWSMLVGAAVALSAAVLTATALRFWRKSGGGTPWRALPAALSDMLTLRNLRGGGIACERSFARRVCHTALLLGFALCFAATVVATYDHHVLGWLAPYPIISLPAPLGTAGGLGMIVGSAGLAWIKATADPALAACRTKVCRQGMRSLMARKGDRRRAFMQPSARTSASSSRP